MRNSVLLVGLLSCAVGAGIGFVAGRATAPTTPGATETIRIRVDAAGADAPLAARQRVTPTATDDALPGGVEPRPQAHSQAAITPQPKLAYEDVPTPELLGLLRRAAAGERSIDAEGVIRAMVDQKRLERVPLEVLRGLNRNGHYLNVWPLVEELTDAELRTILRDVRSATPDDRASWLLAHRAALTVNKRGLAIAPALIDELLAHEWGTVRRVGIVLAAGSESVHREGLLAVARSEESTDVRSRAIIALVESESGRATPETLAVLRASLEAGSTDLRRKTAPYLELAGPGAGAIAADVLAQSRYAPDGEIAYHLYASILAGGHAPRVLAGSQRRATRGGLAFALADAPPDDPAIFAALEPHFGELAAALSEEQLWEFYARLATRGHAAFVAQAALDAGLPASRRAIAYAAVQEMVQSEEDAGHDALFVDLAARIVWDDEMSVAVRAEALDAIGTVPGSRDTAFALQVRVLRDGTTPPALREAVLEDITQNFRDDDVLRARLPQIREVWQHVADHDPVAWVRARAREVLADTYE